MGVQGLTRLLQEQSRPQVVTRVAKSPPSKDPADILLVDASAVSYHLVGLLERSSLDWAAGANFHATLYKKACGFYQGLQNCGLRCVLVTDSACAPEHEQRYVDRRRQVLREGQVVPATVEMVMQQAYRDLGLQVERSVHSADPLLLAWYHRNRSQIFAVLTDDSDFFVYGVQRIVHSYDIVIDRDSVTFHVWNVDAAWQKWQLAAASRGGGSGGMYLAVGDSKGLKRRAQIAIVLGNDTDRSIRVRLKARQRAHKGTWGLRASPAKAAREVLLHPTGKLDVDFFRREPLSLGSFDAEDLQAFNEQVQQYIDDDAAARSGTTLDALTITEKSLPWLAPHLVQRIASGVIPLQLIGYLSRGFACLTAPEPQWNRTLDIRKSAASKLVAPGAVFEYNAFGNTLHQLTPEPQEAAHARPSDWFDASQHLPEVPLGDDTWTSKAQVQAQGSVQETVEALRQAWPGMPETMVLLHAVMLHAVEAAADEAAYEAEVRQVLLPGVPLPRPQSEWVLELQPGADPEEERAEAEAAARALPGSAVVVPVGSLLTDKDWKDIDATEVVAKAKSSVGYTIMTKLQPYNPSSLVAPVTRNAHELFPFFYASAQQDGRAGKLWAELAGACFPREYAQTKEGDKAAVKAKHKELMAAGKNPPPMDARLKTWLDKLKAFVEQASPSSQLATEMLALRREAALCGPDSLQWNAAKVCWSSSAASVKMQAMRDMWSCLNSAAHNHGGPPMRHPHQQDLLDMVHTHLTEAKALGPKALPLNIMFSTPTGSGKTFSAVMMHLHLLHPRPEVPGQYGEGHPDTVLLYSVPTKQVLKKVGQDCEAHRVVYWTAAKDNDMFQVRRPYSIRSQRGAGATGSGSMAEQLETQEKNGRMFNDIGGGQPAFIVADVHSTAAILRAAADANVDAWYHSSKLVLYLDEPSMGIHLDPSLQKVIKEIMRYAPLTTILASATLPAWDQLPRWWKGQGGPATRTVISQEPYGLPLSRLEVLKMSPDGSSGSLTPVSILHLFTDLSTFKQQLSLRPRLGILLLRHLSTAQANQLLLDTPRPVVNDSSVAESDGWAVVDQDVSSLRQALAPLLSGLDPARFEQLREQWLEPTRSIDKGWSSVISAKGVTMVATLDPRRVALEIAGKWRDPEGWDATIKDIRAKIRAARASQKMLAKESRSQKKSENDVHPGMQASANAGVVLRRGLEVTAEQAEETDDDLLAMVSKGVAYAACNDTDPLVTRLYQQALLWIPERNFIQPSINVLVVDYSSIYGTDCTSVDTLVMCKDLGEHLSFEDHQQFIGRLRRDGTAIYPSWQMLCHATTGITPTQESVQQLLLQNVKELLQGWVTASSGADASAEAARKLQEVRRRCDPAGELLGRGDPAACVLIAALASLLEGPDAPQGAAALFKAAVARLQKWGAVKPSTLMRLKAPGDQAALVTALEQACFPAAPATSGALPLIAAKLLQWLYDEDIVNEEAMHEWVKQHTGEPNAGASAAAAEGRQGHPLFMEKVIRPFMTWLQEADEEDEDEDE